MWLCCAGWPPRIGSQAASRPVASLPQPTSVCQLPPCQSCEPCLQSSAGERGGAVHVVFVCVCVFSSSSLSLSLLFASLRVMPYHTLLTPSPSSSSPTTTTSDDTPMVRRAASSALGEFAGKVEPDAAQTELLPLAGALACDDQDSVRLLACENCVAFAKLLPATICTAQVQPRSHLLVWLPSHAAGALDLTPPFAPVCRCPPGPSACFEACRRQVLARPLVSGRQDHATCRCLWRNSDQRTAAERILCAARGESCCPLRACWVCLLCSRLIMTHNNKTAG